MANLADVIVDDSSEASLSGNSEAARKALTEAVTSSAESKQDNTSVTTTVDDGLPTKFKGKSAKDIAEAYQNLESRYGSMANDLGVQRQLTDRLLGMKREDDLKANGGSRQERPKPAPVTTNDILDRPQETLERVVNDGVRGVREDTDTRIRNLEAQLARSRFENRHSDYQATVQNPEFIEWVKASPLRVRAATVANAGDWAIADELFTEYEQHGKQRPAANTTTTRQESSADNLEEARRASYTSSGSNSNDGQGKPTGKIYKRADLMKLMIEDPESYYDEGFQSEIILAHHEKRVR